ncbi:TolC family protein [Vibrio sp. WJH972]
MKISRFNFITVMLCSTTLIGCSTTRSDFHSPELDISTNWSQTQGEKIEAVHQPNKWWELFNDSQLDSLIDQVFASNSDLAKATLTLRKARLEAGLSENNKLPNLGFSNKSSLEYDIGDDSTVSSSSSLSLSYELDLWGRVDAVADADEWMAKASYQDRESTAQSLVVTTATLYWKVGYLNQMIGLTQKNIDGTEHVARLTQNKYDSGSATRLEVLESKQALFTQQIQLSKLQQELAEAQNAISILVNQPLQDIGIRIDQLSTIPVPEVEAGIPSDLLLRRPDVKATLYALRSSLANQDAVASSYMPTITLTSSLSSSSSNLIDLLQNPIATLGSGIVLPFLEWNKMKLNKRISEIDYEIAVINYRETIYQALEEVANLLATKESYRQQGSVYQQQYLNAQEIERIYSSKYQNGASDMIDWINAMELRRSIESTVLENRYNQFVTQIKLYQSLGGADSVPQS